MKGNAFSNPRTQARGPSRICNTCAEVPQVSAGKSTEKTLNCPSTCSAGSQCPESSQCTALILHRKYLINGRGCALLPASTTQQDSKVTRTHACKVLPPALQTFQEVRRLLKGKRPSAILERPAVVMCRSSSFPLAVKERDIMHKE